MKIKVTLKNTIITIVCAIFILIAFMFLLISIASKKPTAAFYGISDTTQKKITEVLQTTYSRKNKRSLPFNVVTLDNSISLERALKKQKADILFIYSGKNAEYAEKIALKKHTTFDSSVLNGMTSSVKKTISIQNGKIGAVPLLIDHWELNVNTEKFNASKIKNLNNLDDLEKLARITKSSTPLPIIFAGGENESLINFFGALTEAVSGKEAYLNGKKTIEELINSGKANYNSYTEILKELIKDGNAYHETYKLLKSWMQKELLPKNIYQMNTRDIKIMMQGDVTTAVFLPLSEHRTIERSTISKFSTVFIPSKDEKQERTFSAPIIYGISLKKNKIAKNAITQMATDLQPRLTIGTGLAPVKSNSSVPDIQADDVRYWVAASNTPFPALADSLFTTKSQKSAFAEALRTILS